jgi:hypothetical protein
VVTLPDIPLSCCLWSTLAHLINIPLFVQACR